MSRILIPAPGFNGVAVGQPATCNLEVGANRTYAGIFGTLTKDGTLVTLANLGTDVDSIRIEADGDVLRTVTPALLLDYLQSQSLTAVLTNGAAGDVYSFYIPFSPPSRRDVVGEELTSLGTLDVKQLQIVVVLKNPGAVTYTLDAEVDIFDNQPKPLGLYERWNVDSFDIINGAKTFNTTPTIDDLFGILFHASTITRVKVFRDGKPVFDATKAKIEGVLRANGLGSATANYYPWVQDYTRQVTDRLALIYRDPSDASKIIGRASSFNIEVTASAASTIAALRRSFRFGKQPGS